MNRGQRSILHFSLHRMRKIAIAFLLRSSGSPSFGAEPGAACVFPCRHLATGPSNSALQDAVAVAFSETSLGASQIWKAPEMKESKRPKKDRSGCTQGGAEGPLVNTEVSTVKAEKRSRAKAVRDAYAENSTGVVASKGPTSSVGIVSTEKATLLTEFQVVEAKNMTLCENAAAEHGKELASCSISCSNESSPQDALTEILGTLDLHTYKYGDRWADAARKLLEYGIMHAHVKEMLKKCKTLFCSRLWVDSRIKHLTMLGISHRDIGRMISKWPTILNVTDRMFQQKMEFYKSLGVDGRSLGKIIKGSVMAITKPLAVLTKNLAFWTEYLKDEHANAVCSMLLNNPRVLTYISFEQKLVWLEARDIKKHWLVTVSPILSFSLPLLMLKDKILEQFGIPDGKQRAHVFIVIVHTKIQKLQARYDNLLAVGFSRDQVQRIILRAPSVLTCTEDYVNSKVNYVLHDMNVPLDTLACSSSVWSHNFENRIKSRHEVIKKLESLGALGRNLSLDAMVRMRAEDFNRRFVKKLQNVLKQAETRSA